MSTSMRFTVSDLELLPDDGKRYEVIDGELYVSTTPDWRHQLLGTQLGRQLLNWDPGFQYGMPIIAPGLIFAPDQAVEPDVVWVSRERIGTVVGDDGKLHAAPDLVVEILSPGTANQQRDRELKLKLYSRYGVREYWIVDWRDESVQIYRREQTALTLVSTVTADETLTSPLLPGFAVTVRELCARPA
ncbi:MAG: Uma2 family endonuclease [Chloroflexi bacterium]|nr:Uma2 family endonuclease [Chloroflexota bacterium]